MRETTFRKPRQPAPKPRKAIPDPRANPRALKGKRARGAEFIHPADTETRPRQNRPAEETRTEPGDS